MGDTSQSATSDATFPIHHYTFTRTPREFHNVLMEGEDLRPCREALHAAGYDPQLESGVKAFVHPWQYEPFMRHLNELVESQTLSLVPKHVFVAPDFQDPLLSAVRNLSSKLRVKAKPAGELRVSCEDAITMPAMAESAPSFEDADACDDLALFEQELSVKNTFIHVKVPSSLYSDRSQRCRTASSTDANPRARTRPRLY